MDVYVPKRIKNGTFMSMQGGWYMFKRNQTIGKNGEVLYERTYFENDYLTDEGYRFPSHKAGARLFAEIEFPNGVSDSDIGKMTRLSKYMIGETNALGFRSGKKIYPYPEYRIFEIVGIKSVKRGREFLQRMLQHRIMKKKEIDGSNYYVINPAYFMVSGKRLTLSLFLEFQQEIAPLLPGHVLAWFLNQAKEDKLLAVVKK